MYKFILNVVREVSIVVITLMILIGSLLGMRLPYIYPVTQLDNYQIAAFETGIAFYQVGSDGFFYNISTMNDYYIDRDGQRQILLSADDFKQKNFKTHLNDNKIKQITTAIPAYLGIIEPFYRLDTMAYSVDYFSEKVDSDTIKIKRTINLNQPQTIQSQALTFSYSDGAVVFDPDNNNIFTPVSPEQVDWLNKMYNLSLRPAQSPSDLIELPSKRLSILNPRVTGIVTIEAGTNQIMTLDKLYRLIEIQEGNLEHTNQLTQEFKIRVLPTSFANML